MLWSPALPPTHLSDCLDHKMASSSASWVLLWAIVAAISLMAAVQGCYVQIQNHCTYPVTTCAQSAANAISQYQLAAGASQTMDFGSACSWPSATVWASVKGQCVASGGNAAAANDKNLANLAEFNIASPTDYYDVSNVNAYTIGIQIQPAVSSCGAPSCSISDIASFCGSNNQLVSLASGALSCVNTDGTAGLGPTAGTELFKAACPSAYSYNYDDATSTYTCAHGNNYNVIFCPAQTLQGVLKHADM